jgi:leader peptidase (prepilin peptidase) / N-methyltransferase
MLIFGACVGSFLNVVVYRMPAGLSLWRPRSHCPHCGFEVPTYGLIPILGWFILKGKCLHCKEKISPEYPMVEFFTAICVVLVTFYSFPHYIFENSSSLDITFFQKISIESREILKWLTALWLLFTGIALSIIDIKWRILPDEITLGGSIISFVFGANLFNFYHSLYGLLLGWIGLATFAYVYQKLRGKEGMGFGDVKYLGMLGAILGWQGVVFTMALASIAGSVVGIFYGIANKKFLSTSIPFGPFLATAALVVFLWEDKIKILFKF